MGFSFYLNEGNILFNDALNTFYLRLYGVSYLKDLKIIIINIVVVVVVGIIIIISFS